MKFFIKSRLYSYAKCTTKPHFVFFPTVVFRCAFCFPHGKSCLNHFIFHFQMIKIYLADLQKQFLDFINNFYRNSPAILSIILLEQSFDLVKNCLFLFNRVASSASFTLMSSVRTANCTRPMSVFSSEVKDTGS